jgi:hypothetical protein
VAADAVHRDQENTERGGGGGENTTSLKIVKNAEIGKQQYKSRYTCTIIV